MQLISFIIQVAIIYLSLCDLTLALDIPVIPIEFPPPTELDYTRASPSSYCFAQGDLRGQLNATTIKYNLIIAPEHVKQPISMFVGFSRKSEPGKLWLLGGLPFESGTWKLYHPAEKTINYPYPSLSQFPPIVGLYILREPTDLTRYDQDGELWVGYGLKSSAYGELNQEAFQEMLSANRYKKIWVVGQKSNISISSVCINITWFTVTTANQPPL